MEKVDGRCRGAPVKRIVVTGSECTGKTTLAGALAEHFKASWVPEFARDFVSRKGAPPTATDLDDIARGQIDREEELARQCGRLLILDTDLLSTVIYGRHYYRACPQWIEAAAERRAGDLYLLAGIDVPWVADGDQRDRGDRRQEMQALFRDTLTSRGLRFVEIYGGHSARVQRAVAQIDRMPDDDLYV